ncbi:ion channel [Pantoea endophytica]
MSIFHKVLEVVIRTWNWRKQDHLPLPRISESIENAIQANELVNGTIALKRICFSVKLSEFQSVKLEGIRFEKCIFSQEDIKNYVFDKCEFVDCVFNGTKISDCEFHKCNFLDCVFFKAQISRTYIDPASFIFNSNWHWHWPNVNAWFFQTLFRNSKDMHQETFAMHADKKFQFYKRYEYLRGRKRHPIKFVLSLLYDYLLGYGYGIKNSLFVTILIIMFFAYLTDGHLKQGENSFLRAIYFSVVSFTTAGYGDISPQFELIPMSITMSFLLISMAWCAVVTAIIVKRIVR